MPMTRSISDLIAHTGEIAAFCRQSSEPVLITHNGCEEIVLMSAESYRRQQALLEAYIPHSGKTPVRLPSAAREKLLSAARLLQECLPGND